MMSEDGPNRAVGGEGGADSGNPITLAVPRPQSQRNPNVYVDTPFQHRVSRRQELFMPRLDPPPAVHASTAAHRKTQQPSKPSTIHLDKKQQQQRDSHHAPHGDVVSSQPTLTFTKTAPEEDSIICGRCGRCRCEACTTPRSPSGAWVCGGKCHLSPAAAVDYVSCLCCVKGVLYHCGKDQDEETPAVSRPCSCAGPDACLRWSCLALSAVPLPCLLCYWPLTAIRTLCEKTYRRFTTQGCRCPRPPEKRLLQDCL